MFRKITLVTALALAAFASSSAAAVSKGTSMFAIQLSNGMADLYDPSSASTSGYISAYDHSEVGVQASYWMLMSEDYALALSAGMGFFGEKNEPGDASLPGDPTFEYKQSSFNVRIGGDRVVNIGERAVLYFGPGFEYWSGKAEFDDGSTPTLETENVSRISLSGRMGGVMTIGSGWGLTGEMGHKIGMASAEDQGAKASWMPSSFDAKGGIIFLFGGSQ